MKWYSRTQTLYLLAADDREYKILISASQQSCFSEHKRNDRKKKLIGQGKNQLIKKKFDWLSYLLSRIHVHMIFTKKK